MKTIIIVVVLTLCYACSHKKETGDNTHIVAKEEVYLINPDQFDKKMSDTDVVVLDVRTPTEIAGGVIGNPVIINYHDPDFESRIKQLDKDKTYLVYCKAGGRSSKTKQLMDINGFQSVYDLQGGITAWTATGRLVK